VKENLLRKL
jgi:ferritin-like metal-binding protein YciE